MSKMKKFLSLCLCMVMLVSCIPAVFAAEVAEATIDTTADCSLTLFKYDWTNAHKDGVWNEDSFISTGWQESYVETVLGGAIRQGDSDTTSDLGNGETSQGYAIKGVEFSYLKVADIVTFTESVNDGHASYNLTKVLYGFDKDDAEAMLNAIGLGHGNLSYANAANTDKLDGANYWYYESDTLNEALEAALVANSTNLKNALEEYMSTMNAPAMPLTSDIGKTSVSGLEVGLYLIVETKVPEMVTSTTNPFFVSLPMTTISGNEHSASPEGGHYWNYDVVLYPKNETGLTTLEKTVRESKADTGDNNASLTDIHDGYSHLASGSAGDVMEYQIITTLPSITSDATKLSTLTFNDTISAGISYNADLRDVKIEFFTDAECTPANKVANWTIESGKFTVEYSADEAKNGMLITITPAGLAEINGTGVNVNGQLFRGYSNYTLRITYTATVDSDNSAIIGDTGNKNEVVLTWSRSSTGYYDILVDDAHVYTYGIDLIKLFSDVDSETATAQGMFEHVKFKLWNETDQYWVVAELNEEEGIWYVTDHVSAEADGTAFYPVTTGENMNDFGHIMIKGLEDDAYILTEIETANGYTLLKDNIDIVITAVETAENCDIYETDLLGLIQNDPRYGGDAWANKGTEDLTLALMPQKQLAHKLLTASATVDGNAVEMISDTYINENYEEAESVNAEVPLTVKNTRGFNPPKTGDDSAQILAMAGTVMLFATACFFFLILGKKSKKEETVR